MTATIVVPKLAKSCRAFLLGNATQVHAQPAAVITELRTVYIASDGWINFFVPDPAQLPRNAIKLSNAGGLGPYRDQPGYTRGRVQFDCYGETAELADVIATLVKLALLPPHRNQQGWFAEDTRVTKTLGVTGPLPGVEPNTQPPAPLRTVTADLELLEALVNA